MWITIDQILCLKSIHESGSITAASARLNKAKSAIHYSLKKLEEQLNFPLVENSGYRSQLTRQALQFLDSCEPLLRHYDLLKERAHQISTGAESKIAISASALFPLKQFNKYIRSIQMKFPQTEIVFHREILSGKKFLRQNLVDVAIFEHPDNDPELEIKKVTDVTMHLVISHKHPLSKASRENQTMEALLQFPQVIQRATIPADEDYGVHRKSRQWTVSDLATKKQILMDGLGWGRLPEHTIESEIKKGRLICLRHIQEPEKIPIFIGRKKSSHYGKVNQALWQMITES